MAKRIIECQVNDEYVLGSGVVVGAAGSHDDVVLRLAFGEMWVGRNIYATFNDANGENPVLSMLMASMLVPGETMTYDVTIPPEAKRYAGKMMLTLTGYSIVDGVQEDMATNTTTAYFRVLPSDFSPLDDGTVTPTLAQQVQNELGEYYSVFEEQYSKIKGVETAENDRKTAEEGRVLAESERAVAEKTRSENEDVRLIAEGKRKTAEIDRAAAEDARKETDKTRNDFLGDLKTAVDDILAIQEKILNGDAELVAKEEVIKAINEKMLIADDLETDDPYKALSAAQGVVLKSLVDGATKTLLIANDLVTNDPSVALSAAQGVVLKALADSATKTVSGWYNGTDSKILELVFPFVPKFVFIAGIGYYDVDEDTRARDSRFGVIIPQEGIMLCQSGNMPNIHQTLEGSPNISLDGNTLILDAGNLVTTDRGVIFNIFLSEWPTYKPATRESAYGYRYFAIG